jgi:ligand-binding sensor domain-containing protein
VEAIPTDAPAIIDTPTPAITITPTPGYAVPKVAFGKTGINPGQFTNPKFIVTDGSSTLYVAEDTGGRVQAFDLSGNYLYQWKVGNENTIIEGLAADRKGGVFISHDGYIYHYDGKTGDPVGKLNNTKGGEFGDLFMTPEGNLAAVWYEGRWGMITGLDGHSEALVIFSPAGKVLNTISSPISNQTGEPALDIYVAMDGKDDIYLMDEGTIYAYSPEGKYLNMFKPAQLSSPTAIRVDDLGQLFVGDSRQVIVLSSNGSFVTSFQVDHSVTALAYDDNSSLWVLTDQQVTQFVKNAQ